MNKAKQLFIGILLLTLVLGGMISNEALASGDQRFDEKALAAVNPDTLTLRESVDGSTGWTTIIGNLADGYSMVLDPDNDYEYLDIETLEATPALAEDGLHEIYFDAFRAPITFWTYWDEREVNADATGDNATMWEIISGERPMFYIKADSGSYSLVDGYVYATESGNEIPWRVNGDLPLDTYHFGGWVNEGLDGEEYLNIQMTFTKVATVSLEIKETDTWTIDGCGYLDVYIHLANVHDLYAVDVALDFNETVLEVVDLDDTAEGINLAPVDGWFTAGYWAKNEADNEEGTIRYAAVLLNTAEPVNDDGRIAKIRFRANAIVDDTPITITSAELSDRDGFLVGREEILGDATITTQFTEAGGLDLGIERISASTVQLSWPGQSTDLVTSYKLHHSHIPYFVPDSSTVYQTITNDGVTNPVTFDDEVLGDVVDNDFYSLQVTCSNGFESPPSWQVGKFEFELFESFDDTDFTWVGLVLDTQEAITDASGLADHIQLNSNKDLSVITVSEWSASGQNFNLFDTADPLNTYDFPVNFRFPYMIEVDLTGISTGTAIWAQVGKLPPIETDTYSLFESFDDTDFTWVLQPLDLIEVDLGNQLDSVEELAAHVSANASPSVSVITISMWNPSSQQYETYYPDDLGSIFSTRFGYPYQIEVNVNTGLIATWP